MGSQFLTSITMKLVILSLCLALACALPTSQKDSQTWRPAAGKDLSKYKLKTPAISFAPKTESTSAKKPLEFKKGSKSFDDILVWRTPAWTKLLAVMKLRRMSGLGRWHFSSMMLGSAVAP